MQFIMFPPLGLPDYIHIPTLIEVEEWDPTVVVTKEDVHYIKCKLQKENSEVITDKAVFFINPAIPLVPIMKDRVRVGIMGTLSFPHSITKDLSDDMEVFFIKEEAPAIQPPIKEEIERDPVGELCDNLQKYIEGGFSTFKEFKEKLDKIQFIDKNEYGPMITAAFEIASKNIQDENKRKFANLIIREISSKLR